MKILYMHAKQLKIDAGVSGRCPGQRRKAAKHLADSLGWALPMLDESNRTIEASNSLLALVCVEHCDEGVDLAEVRKDIVRARALLGVTEVILSAFAHLSKYAAHPAIAKETVARLFIEIANTGIPVKQVPFGWDKSLEIHVPLHHYNIAFRSFEPNPKLR